MAIQFEELRVQAISLSNQVVWWTVLPTNEDLPNTEFIIERAPTENPSTFDEVGRVTGQFYFVDKNGVPVSKWREIFYRIRVTDSTGREQVTRPFTIAHKPTAIALQIIKHKNIVFSSTNKGRETLIYSYPSAKGRCPDCWDPIGKVVERGDCKTCMGTGRIGGYFPPVRVKAAYQPSTKQNQVADTTSEVEYTTVEMMNFPKVAPKDVLHEVGTGRWWIVNTVGQTEDGRVLISQTLQCKRLDPTRVENDLPLPDLSKSEGLQLVA